MKKTKIVCTIGPASWDKEVLKQMIDNGMNVARLNGAFIDIPEMTRVANLIRELSPDVALMLDIKGHELRLNKFDEDIKVNVGDEVVIGSTKEDKIYVATYMDLFKDIRVGKQILVDKAKTVLEVTKITDGKIYTKVLSGSVIQRGKGLNTPGTFLNNSPITDIDIEQINFAKADKWDFVAASFIRSKEDLGVIKPHLVNSFFNSSRPSSTFM
jgi:pyruvate kinase